MEIKKTSSGGKQTHCASYLTEPRGSLLISPSPSVLIFKMMRVMVQAHRGLLDTVSAGGFGVAIANYIHFPVIESSHLFTCSHCTVPFAPSNIYTVII